VEINANESTQTGRRLPDRQMTQKKSENNRRPSSVLLWLAILCSVLGILISCGQMALMGSFLDVKADAQTRLQADYSPWARLALGVLKREIITDIEKDYLVLGSTTINFFAPQAASNSLVGESEGQNDSSLEEQNSILDKPADQLTAEAAATNTSLAAQSTSTRTPTGTILPALTDTPLPSQTPAPSATATTESVQGNTDYWFYNQGSFPNYKMYPTRPSGSMRTANGMVTFASDYFPNQTRLDSGHSQVYIYVTNVQSGAETVTVTLRSGWKNLGSAGFSVPGSTTSPALFSVSVPTSAHTFQDDARFLIVELESVSGVIYYWDGGNSDARIHLSGISLP